MTHLNALKKFILECREVFRARYPESQIAHDGWYAGSNDCKRCLIGMIEDALKDPENLNYVTASSILGLDGDDDSVAAKSLEAGFCDWTLGKDFSLPPGTPVDQELYDLGVELRPLLVTNP